MKKTVLIVFAAAFLLFMAIIMIFYIVKGERTQWLLAIGGMLTGILPLGLLFLKNNPIPVLFIPAYYLFLVWSIYLGSILELYEKIEWWDTPIHFYKGIFLSLIGITLYKVMVPDHANRKITSWLIFLFTLGLSLTASVIWEIYEYVGDLLVTKKMQLGGNSDTMEDLIAGFIGALLGALYAVRKNKKVKQENSIQ